MDPVALEGTLSELMSIAGTVQRVKAILPVHTFGQMADMTAIMKVADQYGIPVVEDAACALGAKWEGYNAGTWGIMGCFSFHPRKAITTGEGGVIATNDDQLARKLRALRNHGLDPNAPSPDFIMPGFNYRLTEFQAALGSSQMKKLNRIIAARRRLAYHYDNLLENEPVHVPATAPQSFHVYQSYVVLLPEDAAPRRVEIIQKLREQDIETNIGTWHMPLTTYFRTRYGHKVGDFPVSDKIFSRALTLPLFETLGYDDQKKVADYLQKLVR